jgi:hypothetical protein
MHAIREVLGIILCVAVAAIWIWLQWAKAKLGYSKDLGDGGIQTLFDKDSK